MRTTNLLRARRAIHLGSGLVASIVISASLLACSGGQGASTQDGTDPQAAGPEGATTAEDSARAASGETGPSAAAEAAGSSSLVPHEVTFYGYPDNSPRGAAISFPQKHQQAGGTGTYDDPVTFAADPRAYAPGTILYLPYLRKYAIMEDRCSACVSDWSSGRRHIDVWMNSDAYHGAQLRSCQYSWTRPSIGVERNPPPNRPVSTAPLFDVDRGVCRGA